MTRSWVHHLKITVYKFVHELFVYYIVGTTTLISERNQKQEC